MTFKKSYGAGLSGYITDRWIDSLTDELYDWDPELGSLPHILEDLNFYAEFSPYPLSTRGN
jgi:hypothetical protein